MPSSLVLGNVAVCTAPGIFMPGWFDYRGLMDYFHPVFITISTYGTRLHGDERGSVNRRGTTLRAHFVAPNQKLERIKRAQMNQPPMVFDTPQRTCVHHALESFCAYKQWLVLALHVRTNHIHALIYGKTHSQRIVQGIKAAATRALREAGLIDEARKVWTEGASITTCETDEDIATIRDYIKNRQGNPLPME